MNDDYVPPPLPAYRERLIDENDYQTQGAGMAYMDDGIPEDILLESIRDEQDRQKRIQNERILLEQLTLLEESQKRASERRILEREEKYQRIIRKITNLMKFTPGEVSDLLFVESIIRQYIRHNSDTLYISYTDYVRFTSLIHKNFREGEYIDLLSVIRKIPSQLSMSTKEDNVDEEAEVFGYEDEGEF